MGHHTILGEYAKGTREFLERFYFYFSLGFFNFGAFLIKQRL